MNMPDEKRIALSRMGAGQSGIITRIEGGTGLVNRLNALDIRLGKRITKISSMIMRGPVTVEIDNTQVAIGFGMAKKIIVDLD